MQYGMTSRHPRFGYGRPPRSTVSSTKNFPMLLYRQRHKLTQSEAAVQAGIAQGEWSALECFGFIGRSQSSMNAIITDVAMLLEIDENEITPPSFIQPTHIPFSSLTYPEEHLDVELNLACNEPDPFRQVDDADLKSELFVALRTLSYREREIILLRYGLSNGHDHTLREIAKIFKVTRERARQIEFKAIRKLQSPTRSRRLEGFLPVYRKCADRRKISRVGQVIRWYLRKHRMSQSRFAEETQLTPCCISRLVSRDNVSAKPDTLARLAQYWKTVSHR